ncbi:MAG: hypothetical protein GY801_36030 [bacterium]|nr:hypothetical protein [bacterium]
MRGSVRGEPGDRLSYRVAFFLTTTGYLTVAIPRNDVGEMQQKAGGRCMPLRSGRMVTLHNFAHAQQHAE